MILLVYKCPETIIITKYGKINLVIFMNTSAAIFMNTLTGAFACDISIR